MYMGISLSNVNFPFTSLSFFCGWRYVKNNYPIKTVINSSESKRFNKLCVTNRYKGHKENKIIRRWHTQQERSSELASILLNLISSFAKVVYHYILSTQ
jgi:hypothetical protein